MYDFIYITMYDQLISQIYYQTKYQSMPQINTLIVEQSELSRIIKRQYESRSQAQHRLVVKQISPYFPTLSANTIKLISFYMRVVDQNSEDKKCEGIVLKIQAQSKEQQQNPESTQTLHKTNNNTNLFIPYTDYLSCLSLGETSIQQQISFFNSSEYLCSMPKKKLYNILRNSKVLSFVFRQHIYQEGQLIANGESGSGVYLVRQGEFAYFKQIKAQQIQVFRFAQGHLLGSIQLENQNSKRLFTVRCKNSRAIVYQMTHQFFNSFIKPYCENVIQQKQKKLQKFLTVKSNEMEDFKQRKTGLQSQMRKSYSTSMDLNQNFRATKTQSMLTSRQLPSLIKTSRLSERIQQDQLRKTSYMGLKYQGALKHYPMASQRSKFMQSEFRDLQKLTLKNEGITRIRDIKRSQVKQSKQQILFGLFESSWKFNKDKMKKIRLNC